MMVINWLAMIMTFVTIFGIVMGVFVSIEQEDGFLDSIKNIFSSILMLIIFCLIVAFIVVLIGLIAYFWEFVSKIIGL